MPVKVDGDYALCTPGDARLDEGWVKTPGCRIDVHKNGFCPDITHRIGGCNVRKRRDQHLIARAKIQREQGQMQCHGSIARPDRGSGTTKVRELPFKAVDELAS
jgi:hypothetical protein